MLPLRHPKVDPWEAMFLPPRRAVLDYPTRQGLAARGWKKIRQSDLASYRSCPASLQFTLQARLPGGSEVGTINQFLGSLLHEVLASPGDSTEWFNPAWWMVNASAVRARHPHTKYIWQGKPLSHGDVQGWCNRMVAVEDKFGGRSVAHLLMQVHEDLRKRRYEVLGIEETVSIPDGDEGEISFDGTLDFLVRRAGQIGVLDLKSYGLLDTLLDGSAPKAQRPDVGVLRFDSQLRHYGMLLQMKYATTVSFVGHIYPANLCPQLTGPDKGKPKGPALVVEHLVEGDIEEYQAGVVATLRQAALPVPWAKTFPTYFGAPKCLKMCGAREVCFKTSSSDGEDLADLFDGLTTGDLEISKS